PGARLGAAEAFGHDPYPEHQQDHARRLQSLLQRCPKVLGVFTGSGKAQSAAFSPDGLRLITARDDKMAQIRDLATGEPVGPALKHRSPVSQAQFNADGQRVLTCTDDGAVQIWNALTGEPVAPALKQDHKALRAMFSPDGRQV